MARHSLVLAALAVGWAMTVNAQTAAPINAGPATGAASRLGAGDVIQIHAVEEEGMSDKPIRISSDGYINLPTVGRLKAADRTAEDLQAEIVTRLKRLIVNPDVSVTVVETHSHPVSVVGAVKTPGVFELQGRRTLLEILSLAGGPRDDAGYTARITRRMEFGPLPLSNATEDPSGQFSVAEINLQKIMDARDPAGNIVMMPNDVISVPKAEMIYVIGDVLKPGAIAVGDQKTVTVLQAISIASGLGKTAKSTEAKILRVVPGYPTARTEVAVNLKMLLAGKISDVVMQPEDVLFVPTSLKKDFALKTIEALGGAGVASVIYRVP
jgi:polysaccharide export outer membrane protein